LLAFKKYSQAQGYLKGASWLMSARPLTTRLSSGLIGFATTGLITGLGMSVTLVSAPGIWRRSSPTGVLEGAAPGTDDSRFGSGILGAGGAKGSSQFSIVVSCFNIIVGVH
jgi:hypothetical protein